MAQFKDYYKILQVDSSAELDIIEAAFRRLSKIYYPIPGRNTEEKFKEITEAHSVLKDPIKREKYDEEYKKFYTPRPRPEVDKSYILFDAVKLGEIKTDYFILRNTGGDYENIDISVQTPNSWLKITGLNSLDPNQSDELPLRVEIEATADEWGKNYTEYVIAKLDYEEVRIKVELNTKSKAQQPPAFNKKKLIPIVILPIFFLIFSCIGINYLMNRPSKQNDNTIENKSGIFEESTTNSDITSVEKHNGKTITENWEQVGLSGETVSDLIIADADTLYAATIGFNHGIFKSSDGGNTWNAINNGLGSLEVYDIDIFANDSNSVVASTESGIWFTQDGGKHWQPLGPTNYQYLDILSVSVLPKDPSTITAVGPANYGAFITHDTGGNWQEVSYEDASGDDIFWNEGCSLTCSASEPTNIIYLVGPPEIYRSSDGGETWSQMANVGANYNVSFFTVDQSNGDIVYAMADYYEGNCLYKSTDGGGSWIPINNGLPNHSNEIEGSAIAINPSNRNNIYVAIAGQVYASNDSGDSWRQLIALPEKFSEESWPIINLVVNDAKNILYIETNKNGIWCTSIAN